jgi:glycosyltransferase 2 family protein
LSEPAPRERFRIVQVVLAVLGAALLVLLIRRAGVDAILDTFARVRPQFLLLDALVVAGIFVAFALRWRLLARALGCDPPFRALLGARLAGLSVGTLTPGAKLGGEPLRAYLLARAGTPAGPAIATVVVDRGVELVANVVFALVYCALFAFRDATAAGRVLAVVVAAGVGLALAVRVAVKRLEAGRSLVPQRFRPLLERLGAPAQALADTDRALHELLFRHRAVVLASLGWALLTNVVIFLDYVTIFAAFGPLPTLPDLAGSMLGVGLAHALPVPASLGALEGAQAAVFELAGESQRAIVAASVTRLRDVAWTVPGLVYLAAVAVRRRALGRATAR